MNFCQKSTLEKISLINVTIALWSSHDVKKLLRKFTTQFSWGIADKDFSRQQVRKEWQIIENVVKEKASQVIIPTKLKEKLSRFILPIGLQIFKWIEYHWESCFDLGLPSEFYWTSLGTIDKEKTASVLLNNQSADRLNVKMWSLDLNVTTRFKLACNYCLEDEISKIWNEIPENRRILFYDKGNPSSVEQHQLVILWTYFVKGETARIDKMTKERQNCSPFYYGFKCAAGRGNKEATRFFLQKLTSAETSLVETALYIANKHDYFKHTSGDTPKEYLTDVLCFLLSQMDEEQQIQVFKSCPSQVLQCFLDWPWQNMFLQTARHFWNFLTVKDYDYLLRVILHKISFGYKDYNYRELFGGVYQQITHEGYALDCQNIYSLLEIKDKENIDLIFQTVYPAEKKSLIFCNYSLYICTAMICDDDWDMLKFYIRHCITSKSEIMQFKQEFQHPRYPRINNKRELFFELLDDLACEFEKIKSLESNDDISSTKKLHS